MNAVSRASSDFEFRGKRAMFWAADSAVSPVQAIGDSTVTAERVLFLGSVLLLSRASAILRMSCSFPRNANAHVRAVTFRPFKKARRN